ncbi:hypothetical protein A176_004523 [Myxococcus hansupus]|uniref:Uncharacterized protein n=1 Tax=Pseudomyxococcus hansupus TaxID=1297742 RepID=A0A0H4WW39_9BACT|nr:hypothetical protein [Myxococcus hansupus]AKQ67611.1 hypothetical protein A176_004523 [Myxococcus hansupus]
MATVTRSQVVGGGLALLAAGAVLYFWPQQELTVEEAIRRQVVVMTREAEEKNVGGVMEHVSERFRSNGTGGMTKREVRGILTGQVLRGQWVRIFMTNLEVREVSPTEGEFQARFIFGRSQAEKLEDLSADSVLSAYRIEGAFEKEEDGEWRVVRARPYSISPADLL